MKSPNFFEKEQVTRRTLANFHRILRDLNTNNCSYCCPVDGDPSRYCGMRGIPVCVNTFPKGGKACPCQSGYSKSYLKRRVRQIIKHHEKKEAK